MADVVYKKIQLVGSSTESFSDAAEKAVVKAAESVRGISWFEVVEQRGRVADGRIREYQVTINVGFRVE
jgi:flavin-binding protein dodecin